MKTLDWQTLRDDGYLQEVNREFFHPLGLALSVAVRDDGTAALEILDARDDAEGFVFSPDGGDLAPNADRVRRIADARREARIKALGYWQQPTGEATSPWAVPPTSML